MPRLGLLALLLAIAVLLVPITPAAAMNASLTVPGDPAIVNLIASEQALIDLTNQDRIANGVDPLIFDPDTLDIARQRAESQLGTPSLSHYDADGHLIFARLLGDANVSYQLAGENLARSSDDDPTVLPRIEQALMQSPTHRRNILEPTFKRIAIGAAVDPNGQIAFAELYRD